MSGPASTDLQQKRFQDFVIYSDGLTSGDIYRDEKKFVNGNNSYFSLFTRVYEMYDKPPEDKSRVLVGQIFCDYKTFYDNNNKIGAVMGNQTHFFKNGSINVQFSTYNYYNAEIPVVATIVYGTGDYLGAQGYMIINHKQIIIEGDVVKSDFKDTFKFTN